MPNFDDQDILNLAKIAFYEARGEKNPDSMSAVMHVVLNRASQPGRFGDGTISGVISQPFQFEGFNQERFDNFDITSFPESDQNAYKRAIQLASGVVNGTVPDPTGGADHFLNVDLVKKRNRGKLPRWVRSMETTKKIGNHTFLK